MNHTILDAISDIGGVAALIMSVQIVVEMVLKKCFGLGNVKGPSRRISGEDSPLVQNKS